MLRPCRSTRRRKASSSPPLAFATAAASSRCICGVRRWRSETVGKDLLRHGAGDPRGAGPEAHAILGRMFKRQTTGSVVCASCGYLVGVNDEKCYHCGRRNPGLWGFGPLLRRLGTDMGFVPFVMGACAILYAIT